MKKLISIIISLLTVCSICCFSGCEKQYEPEPQIKEGEFPFIVEYELNGQRYLIEDIVLCSFSGHDLSNPFPFIPYSRTWDSALESGDEEKCLIIEFPADSESVLVKGRINVESRIRLYYGSGGYYLGDREDADKAPSINYVEEYVSGKNETTVEISELSFNQLEELFGIKVVRFDFRSPIKNSFE